MKHVLGLLAGIATFILLVVYVDTGLAGLVLRALGVDSHAAGAVIAKVIIWIALASITAGLAFFASFIIGGLVSIAYEVIFDSKKKRKR